MPKETRPQICARNNYTFFFFATRQSCLSHICDHLLSDPECHAWRWIAPDAPIADDNKQRWKQSEMVKSENLCELEDAYLEAVQTALVQAGKQQWHRISQTKGTSVWFSPRAVAVIANARTIATAYVPGAGSAQQTLDRKKKQHDIPIHLSPRKLAQRKHTKKAPDKIKKNWHEDERFFHEIFKPALKHIRACHHGNAQQLQDLGRLKSILPSPSQITFNAWKETLS